MSETIEARAIRWALGDDTGSSSKAIAAVMTGNAPKRHCSYPSDGGDLGRCLRLLDAIPEWKARLPEMAVRSPQWAALVKHWPELKRLHDANDKGLYDRMKAILDPVEATDPNLVKLGKGMSVRFS